METKNLTTPEIKGYKTAWLKFFKAYLFDQALDISQSFGQPVAYQYGGRYARFSTISQGSKTLLILHAEKKKYVFIGGAARLKNQDSISVYYSETPLSVPVIDPKRPRFYQHQPEFERVARAANGYFSSLEAAQFMAPGAWMKMIVNKHPAAHEIMIKRTNIKDKNIRNGLVSMLNLEQIDPKYKDIGELTYESLEADYGNESR
ncbi:MAG: hypothetical protein KAJ07_04630 [Planctomycetes bacterium]|nr:hypothetical protein [Planctomycetota bacterium]